MALPTTVRKGIDPFDHTQSEFDTMLSRLFGNSRLFDGGEYLAPYGVDVREDGDHVYVEAELPGFQKEEVDINIEGQTLAISAQHKELDDKKSKGDWLLHERRYTRFQRAFTLPSNVDPQSVGAKLTDGVLTVTLDKREESKPRKIAVS
jgi:HSP20 family protein